ncbi:MAG: hypothetical protein KF730_01950 [Sphingomonas sp.]|uniref:hypothetical protein n=1 Tax=Sphingomonas sp. TaxID=28214 RepID=UPI0025D04C4D|nr:hypothetical protein [Sphingomonas sp.]MBX3563316.1 hypothetical protein [Sphingomonas sp.]
MDLNLTDLPVDAPAVRYMRPDPRLMPYISGYHAYAAGRIGGGPYHEWFFPGWANVRFRLASAPWQLGYGDAAPEEVPEMVLFGPSRSGAHSISQGGHLVGFGVTPLGWHRLFRDPAQRFADRLTPLDGLWPAARPMQDALRDARTTADVVRIFNAHLLGALRPASPDEALIARLFDLLVEDHDLDLRKAAVAMGCSPQKLRRISIAHFGFPPKILLRRSRFLKSLVAIVGTEPGQWSQRISASYFDQSHFIRDSHYFLGMKPGAFLALDRPLAMLSIKARQAALGAPFQALHRLGASSTA